MDKTMRRRLIIAGIIAGVVILVALGIFAWREANRKPVEVYPVSNVQTSYYGNSSKLAGAVTRGNVQTVNKNASNVTDVRVKTGDHVNVGDVLMTYDPASLNQTLSADQARISSAESKVNSASTALATYRSLRPSEDRPQSWTETVDNGDLEPLSVIDSLGGQPHETSSTAYGNLNTYVCTFDTVIRASALNELAAGTDGVELQLYMQSGGDWTLYGSWAIDPADVSSTLSKQGKSTVTDDWTIGKGVSPTAMGAVLNTSEVDVTYGTLVPCTPTAYQRYSYVNHNPESSSNANDYVYSSSQLATLIQNAANEVEDAQLELRKARVTYELDRATGDDGEVKATVAGTVKVNGDPKTATQGTAVITVEGAQDYDVTVYLDEYSLGRCRVGDIYSAYAYESAATVTIEVTSKGNTPAAGDWSMGGTTSAIMTYYPVTCHVVDTAASLKVGEYCDITPIASVGETAADSTDIYLPLMYVRREESTGRRYVMAATAANRLEKRYVTCGVIQWGTDIQVTEGLTVDDRIAFPYGDGELAGQPTTDADRPVDTEDTTV